MRVVILAGGLGTRISEESHLKPKPMIEIGGQPILWHIMKYYSHFGFNDFIICCGYRGYVIKEYFADYYLHRSDVTFDFKSRGDMVVHKNVAEPWKVTLVDTGLNTQTGGRLKMIGSYLERESFMLTYGDGVSTVDLNALLRRHRSGGKKATVTAVQPEGRFGIITFSADGERVEGFKEKPKETSGWINGGFMVLEPSVLDYIKSDMDSLEDSVLYPLAEENSLEAYKHHGFWQCMDTQRDKTHLDALWERREAPWKVWDD
ncbi:MAG: glucose-1-phosphate cytidylyltransferase [Deltaproteobacteria bacterium]|jgi:glucose-1-phosphate cytidylyltransferase|nr:glucose-1-phosphate cytidylyltransferase [Deltaproteobacteria bacterium]